MWCDCHKQCDDHCREHPARNKIKSQITINSIFIASFTPGYGHEHLLSHNWLTLLLWTVVMESQQWGTMIRLEWTMTCWIMKLFSPLFVFILDHVLINLVRILTLLIMVSGPRMSVSSNCSTRELRDPSLLLQNSWCHYLLSNTNTLTAIIKADSNQARLFEYTSVLSEFHEAWRLSLFKNTFSLAS